MENLFVLGEIFSTLLILAGFFGIAWALHSYVANLSYNTFRTYGVIAVVALIGIVCCISFVPSGYGRLLIMSICLLVIGSGLVIAAIYDVRHGYNNREIDVRWWMHALVILSFISIPVGFALRKLVQDEEKEYIYQQAEVKTIAYVQFRKKIETVMEIIESSNGDFSVPTKQEVERVYLVMTDSTRVYISRRSLDFDYKTVYPAGDTIRVLNGKLVQPRGYYQLP